MLKNSCKILRQTRNNSIHGRTKRSLKFIKSNLKSNGLILKQFKSGRLGPSLQSVPQMECWKEILEITEPKNWSNRAYLEMTKIFISKTESDHTVNYYKEILLPKVINYISTHKTLDPTLYL